MNSTVLAPRPARSNWAKVIYNILHENGNRALDKGNIWALVPSSMHVPHSYKGFTASLLSMVNHHFLEARGQRGAKMFRIATAEVHASRQVVMNGYRLSALAKKKRPVRKARAVRKPDNSSLYQESPKTNSLQGYIDSDISTINDQIDLLIAKRDKLRAMRKLAGGL